MKNDDICCVGGHIGIYNEGKVYFSDGTSTTEEPELVFRVMDKEPTAQVNNMVLPDLEYGSRGLFVYMMQSLLNWHKFTVKPDGCLGVNTLSTLREFRKQHYLDGDTVCDAKTWQYLMTE